MNNPSNHRPLTTDQERTEIFELLRSEHYPENRERFDVFLEAAENRSDTERSAEDYFILASQARFVSDYEEGTQWCQKGLALDSIHLETEAALYNRLGQFHRYQEEFNPAEENFRKAIELQPQSEKYRLDLAFLFHDNEKYPESESTYKKILEINPEYSDAHFHLAELYAEMERNDEAEAEFLEAIRLDPEEESYQYWLGRFYEERGNY